MTALELTRRAITLLAAGTPSSPWYDQEAEVGTLIPIALGILADRVSNEPGRCGLLMQDYSVSLTDGVGNLLTATGVRTAQVDILWQSVWRGVVKDADGVRLMPVPDFYAFQGALLNGYNYYHLTDNGRIIVRPGGATYAPGSVTSPLTVTAGFTPIVTTVPAELEDDLVNILAGLALTKPQAL